MGGLNNEEQEEAKKHNIGCLMFVGGIFLAFLACFLPSGDFAATVGMIGLGLLIIGMFPAINNRSASKIQDDKATARAIVSSWGAKVRAGQSITGKDVDKAISAMGMDSVQKHQQAKKEAAEIVKSAVVGGVIAGEAGAVVGAAVAKNKIDNEKKEN